MTERRKRITKNDPIVKIGVAFMKLNNPQLFGEDFMRWAAHWFGKFKHL